MAEVTIETVPRVYLVDPDYNTRSGLHTAMVGEEGDSTKIHKLEFVFGVAHNVPLNIYRRFHDAGYVTTERPATRRMGG